MNQPAMQTPKLLNSDEAKALSRAALDLISIVDTYGRINRVDLFRKTCSSHDYKPFMIALESARKGGIVRIGLDGRTA